MESKKSITCVICHQVKLAKYFPKSALGGRLLSKASICLTCQLAASLADNNQDDDEGGGGLQLQYKQDPQRLLQAMELEAILLKNLEDTNLQEHEKNIVSASQTLTTKQQTQTAQRELLDLKEDASNASQEDEPNPDLSMDANTRREKIARLFSVTRSLAGNFRASNAAAQATAQKNFSLFTQTKGQVAAQKTEQLHKADVNKALSKESSTLFSQHHTTKEPVANEAEQLANAIREGQKIFNR